MGSIISSGVGSGLDVAGLVQSSSKPRAGRRHCLEHRRGEGPEPSFPRSAAALGARVVPRLGRDAQRHRQIPGPPGDVVDAGFHRGNRVLSAVPGSYSIEVEQLAAAHKLQSVPAFASDGTSAPARCASDGRPDLRHRDRRDQQHAGRHRGRDQRLAAGEKVPATVITGATRRVSRSRRAPPARPTR